MASLERAFRRARRFVYGLGKSPNASRPQTSGYHFEAFEPRVLLSADLAGAVGDFDIAGPIVPGDKTAIALELRNDGDEAARGTIGVDLYASADDVLDASDVLLASLPKVKVALDPGESGSALAKLVIPAGIAPGDYFILADLDTGNVIQESDETNNLAVSAGTREVAWKFGTVPGRDKANSLTIADADGTLVTFALKGDGYGEVTSTPDGFDVALTGTTGASALALKGKGGDNEIVLHNVTTDGSLKQLSGKGTDLRGDLTASGSVVKIALDDISGSTITFGSTGVPIQMKVDQVSDLTIESGTAFKSLAFTDWQDTDGEQDSITAPWIGKLQSKGDFGASMFLSSAGAPGVTFAGAKVSGAITGGVWAIVGHGGKIAAASVDPSFSASFTGDLAGFQIKGDAGGDLAARNVSKYDVKGNLNDARLFIGAHLGADGVRGGDGVDTDVFRPGTLSKFGVKGSATNVQIRAGVDPVNDVFDDGDDRLLVSSGISSISIGGPLSPDSIIQSLSLPASAKIGGEKVVPASDPRFYPTAIVPPRPEIDFRLANDTGRDTTDNITADPTVVGTATQPSLVLALEARVDLNGDFVDISDRFEADGSFTIDLATLERINGGVALPEGEVRLNIRTRADNGDDSELLIFEYDATAPAMPTAELSTASDSGSSDSDGVTNVISPTVGGDAEPASDVEVLVDGVSVGTVRAGAAWAIQLSSLADGDHVITVTATDIAGNVSAASAPLAVTVDSVIPTVEGLDLAPESDTGDLGDLQTKTERVTIVGTTESRARVEVVETGQSTTAQSSGAFELRGVALAPGENTFTFRASDLAGNSSEATVTITRVDATGPVISARLAQDTGRSGSDGITRLAAIAGSITDESGIADLRAGFGDTPVESFVSVSSAVDPDGSFSLDMTALEGINGGPLADGVHTLHLVAEDTLENVSDVVDVSFTLDRTAPSLNVTSPLAGASLDGDEKITGTTSDANGAVAVSYQFVGTSMRLVDVAGDGSFDDVIRLAGAGIGAQSLAVTATDAAGNKTTTSVDVSIDQAFTVTRFTPLRGAVQVGSTFRPQVFFSVPVDAASLTSDNLFLTAGGQKLDAAIVPAGDGTFAWLFPREPMPGGARVTLTVDGSTILSRDGKTLDADGDGAPGGVLTTSFTTVNLQPLAGTSLTGVLMDPGPDNQPRTADDLPLAGVEIYILGLEGLVRTTGADGRFLFDAVPAGNVKVAINGMRAPAPEGMYFPEMVMDSTMIVGRENFVMAGEEHIYLPRLSRSILETIDASKGAMVQASADGAPDLSEEERQFLTLAIQADSLVTEAGDKLAVGMVGISTVEPELVRDMLPPGVLQHTFDITVQAPGISNFSAPAPMTFPNVFGAAPGSQLNFLSFDHTTGRLVIEGTATVSEDGLSVSTDPGTGITHPGWHGLTPPGTETDFTCDPTEPHDIMVEPRVAQAGIRNYFFVNDEGKFVIEIANTADPIEPSKDPCHPENARATPLVVSIQVEGNTGFAKFLTGLSSQQFELGPKEKKKLEISVDDFLDVVKFIDRDRLYGAKVVIKGWKDGAPETLLLDRTMYVGRFLDVADDNHTDGRVELPDTLNDGLAGVERRRPVDRLGFLLDWDVSDTAHFSNLRAPNEFVFDPTATGEGLSTPVNIIAEGTVIGTMTAVGQGTPRNKIFLNLNSLMANFADIADGGDVEVNRLLITDDEIELFNSAAERTALANAFDARYKLLFNPVIKGLEFVNADGADVINYVWSLESQLGSYGTSRKVAGDDGVEDSAKITTAVKDRNKYNLPERAFRLSEAMNQDFDTNVYVYVDSPIEWSYAGQPYELTAQQIVNALAKTAVHEASHTMGVIHTAQGSTVLGANEVQKVELTGGAPGEIFSLTFDGKTTPTMPRTAGAALVQSVLRGLLNIRDNVTVAGPDGGPYVVTFNSTLQSIDLPMLSGTGTGALTVAVTETTKGGGSQGVSGTKQVTIGGVSGTTDIMFGGRNDVNGTNRFQPGLALEALMVGLHLDWTSSTMTKLFTYYAAQIAAGGGGIFSIDGSVLEVDGASDPDASGPPVDGPLLLVLDGDGELLFDALDLGTVTVDGAGGEELIATLTFLNAGTEDVLLGSIGLDDALGHFTSTEIANGTTLTPGESVTLDVIFDPLASGEFTVDLGIVSNDGTAQETISITGLGQSPDGDIRVDVANSNLGGRALGAGATAASGVATVRNIGASDLTVSDILLGGVGLGQFAVGGLPAGFGPASPIVLAPGESFAFDVSFDPDLLGLQRGAIEIVSDDPDTPILARGFVGTGLPDAGSSLDWGGDFVAFETPAVPGATVLRAVSDDGGNFSFFLPSEAAYHGVIFDPVSGLVAHLNGVSATSGQSTSLGTPFFAASEAPDSDGDGLPDDVEFAIGTSSNNADSDGDGIDDFAAVAQGLDPLGGFGSVTGVVGAATLEGEALEVVVESDPRDPDRPLAYVATGSHGLAIVDASVASTPVVLSQLELAGTAVDLRIDPLRQLAVVAGGEAGLHLVDIADPQSPRLLTTIEFAGALITEVELSGGFAYVGVGNGLAVVDLTVEEHVQTVNLGGFGSIVDIAREGTRLYTMDTSRVLRVIDVDGLSVTERGSLPLTHGGGEIFADGGVVYAVATNNFQGGFATVDVSDPDNLSELGLAGSTALPRSDIAVTDSGLALLAGTVPTTFDHRLALLNVADPTQTNAFISQFVLPDTPNAVALGGGRAYVAAGTAGLQVVNYLGFDGEGQAPVVELTSLVEDTDSGTAGVQVVEGTVLSFLADASDDVQVARLELLVNGQVVATDFATPYDLVALAPSIAAAGTTISVRARAVDTGGNVTLSNAIVLELVPDTFGPELVSVDPAAGGFRPTGEVVVSALFSEALDPATVDAASFLVREAGGAVVAGGVLDLRQGGRRAQLTFASLAEGDYELVIDASRFSDIAGNPVGADDLVTSFRVFSGTVFWTNSAGGDWGDPANWSTGAVPDADDVVVIGVSGEATVFVRSFEDFSVAQLLTEERLALQAGSLTVGGGSIFAGGLDITGGTLVVEGVVRNTGSANWTSGTLSGAGSFRNEGEVRLLGNNVRFLETTVLNAGEFLLSDNGHLWFRDATFENLASGAFVHRGSGQIDFNGGTAVFNNAGVFRRSGNTGLATVDVAFNSTDVTISVETGELRLTRGGTNSDMTVDVSAGAALRYSGGTHTFGGTSLFTGDGSTIVSSGVVAPEAGALMTLDHGGDTFIFESGDLGGNGTIVNAGAMRWTGGTIVGAGMTNQGTLDLAGNSSRTLAAVLRNQGLIAHTGLGTLFLRDGTLENEASGTYDFQSDGNVDFSQATSAFNNAGTVRKTVGAIGGFTTIDVPFNSTGVTVSVSAGELRLTRGGSSTDLAFALSNDAVVRYNGGTHTFGGATDLSGTGGVIFDAGTIEIAAASEIVSDLDGVGLSFAGANVTGAGTLRNTGAWTWSSGTLSAGNGAINAAGGALSIVGSGRVDTVLVNEGAIVHTAGNFGVANSGRIENRLTGTYEIQGDADLDTSGGVGVFVNAGLLRKTGAAGLSDIDLFFDNSAPQAVQATTGELRFTRGGTSSGASYLVSAGAQLSFRGGDHALGGSTTFAGTGEVAITSGRVLVDPGGQALFASALSGVSVAGGTLGGAGTVTVASPLTFTSGTLGEAGVLVLNGASIWTGGTLNGVLATNNGTLTLTGTSNKSLNVATFDNRGTIIHENGTLGLGSSVLNNRLGATYDLRANDRQIDTFSGVNAFNNEGVFRRTQGVSSAIVDVAFNNTSSTTVVIESGELILNRGGVSSGASYSVAVDATLRFGGGVHQLGGSTSVGGSGTVAVQSGSVLVGAGGDMSLDATLAALQVTGGGFEGGGDLTIGTDVQLSGGALGTDGVTVVSGDLAWTGGTLGGGDMTLGGTSNLTGIASKVLRGAVNNAGTMNLAGGTFGFQAGTLTNTGTFDIQANSTIDTFSGSPLLDNRGTFRRSGGVGTSTIDVAFSNSTGVALDLQSGDLLLTRGGVSVGVSYTIASGAVLRFGGGTHVAAGDSSFSGAGSVVLQSGALDVAAGGTATFDLAGGLNLTGGILGGDGAAVNDDVLDFATGTIDPATGFTNAGSMTISAGGAKRVGTTLTNTGSIVHTTNTLGLQSGAVENQGSYEFLAGDIDTFSGVNAFRNSGVFLKSGVTNVVIDVAFENSSATAVSVSGGELALVRGGVSVGGSFDVAAGASLRFGGGTHTYAGVAGFSGAGTVLVASGRVDATAGAQVTFDLVGGVVIDGGILGGAGSMSNVDRLEFLTGTIDPSGGFTNSSTLLLAGGGTKRLGSTLTNTGTITHSGGTLGFQTGTLANQGVYELLGGGIDTFSGTNAIVNSGTFRVAGAGALSIDVGFTNAGTLAIEAGDVTFSRGFVQTAGTTSLEGGTLSATSATTIDLQGGVLTGSGTINADVLNAATVRIGDGVDATSTLVINGDYEQTAAGTLEIDLEGTGAGEFDVLDVNGDVTLAGTLDVARQGGFAPATADEFEILTFNVRTGEFDTVNGLAGAGATLDAQYGAASLRLVGL